MKERLGRFFNILTCATCSVLISSLLVAASFGPVQM